MLCNWSYQLKDMVLDIICKKENKTEKGGGWGSNLGRPAKGTRTQPLG